MWCAMPGIIGTRIDSAIASVPMSVSFRYAAADGAQNTSGVSSSQTPIRATDHRPMKSNRGMNARAANIASSKPLTTSLQIIAGFV
jgi:hypothetical protein